MKATGTSAHERERSREEERARERARDRAVELILEAVDERAPLVVVRPALERALDVGELADLVGAVDLVEDVLRDAELVERGDVAVEDDGRARADRLVPVLLERGRQDGREEEQPEHDAGVPGGERPAAVHDLIRPPAEGELGEPSDGEAEPRADQDLRRDGPPPARAWHERERGQPTREKDDAAGDALNEPERARPQATDRQRRDAASR